MRTCAAAVVPNVTLPIWVEMLRSSVGPVVDAFWFLVDETAAERVGGVPELEFKGSRVEFIPKMQHGPAATRIVRECPGETLLLVEDDCLVKADPGELEDDLHRVEGRGNVGAVASCLGCTELEFHDHVTRKWLDCADSLAYDTSGAGFWPNMLVLDLADVRLRTDGDMNARSALAGVPIPELDGWSPSVASGLDTGGWLGVQFRARGGRARRINQNRATPYPRCKPIDPGRVERYSWLHIGQGSYLPRWQTWQDSQGAGYEASVALFEAASRRAKGRWADEARRTLERCEWARRAVGFSSTLSAAWSLAIDRLLG